MGWDEIMQHFYASTLTSLNGVMGSLSHLLRWAVCFGEVAGYKIKADACYLQGEHLWGTRVIRHTARFREGVHREKGSERQQIMH